MIKPSFFNQKALVDDLWKKNDCNRAYWRYA